MHIADKRDEIVAAVRDLKEAKVRSTHDPDHRETNIHNAVHGWRGERPVVAIFPFGLAGDTALIAAHAAATWFSCDALALTAETYVGGHLASPLTGRPWVPGELQRVVEEHRGLETGSVIEALMTFVVNRAGDATGAITRYRVDRTVNALGIVSYDVEWLTASVMDDPDGATVNALVHFMNGPSADTVLAQQMARDAISPADFGLDADETRTHMDCMAVQALIRDEFEGAVILLGSEDDPRRGEIIKAVLGDLVQEMP